MRPFGCGRKIELCAQSVENYYSASTSMNMGLEKVVRSFKFDEVAIYDDDKTKVDIIKEIIKSREQEDAFYILDVADVIEKHKTWLSKNPKVEPFYVVKCNPHPTVVKVLAALNAGFGCASKREIQMVMDFGVPADKIMFASTMKQNSHIKFARECGVKLLTADSESELEEIKIFHPEAQVVIRFRWDAKMATKVIGEKFGCESEIKWRTLIRKAKDLGLNVYGFSFHPRTECQESDAYNRGIKITEDLIEYAKSLGLQNVRLYDIGDGLSGLRDNSMDKFVASIEEKIEGVDPSTRIISEPGRFHVTSAFTLVSLVYKKRINRKSGHDHHMNFTNDGICGSLSEVLFGKKMPSPIPLDPPTKADTNSSSFWSPTCDSLNCIIRDCQYTELNAGDWVMWPNMGDYTLSATGTSNGFHPPIVFPFIKRSQWCLATNFSVSEMEKKYSCFLTQPNYINHLKVKKTTTTTNLRDEAVHIEHNPERHSLSHCLEKEWDSFKAERKSIRNFESVMDFTEVDILEDEKTDFDHARNIIENRNQEDAFYILNVGDVIKKHRIWKSLLPRVVPHFAVKCNPDQTVIKVLAALNASFDCASKHEIEQVQACGVSGDRIIFAHPMKLESHIRFAKKVGVDRFTVDNELELYKIKSIFPEARIIIRFRCDAVVSASQLGTKFGCDSDIEAPKLIEIAKDLGLTIHGFSFHVGSLCEELEAYIRGIRIALRLIEHAKFLGFQDVNLIDIGGGFPGEKGRSFEKFAETVNNVLKEVDSSIRIISEPGRYYVASAFTLFTMVHGKKIVHEKNTKRYMYYTNDGCYGSFVDTLLKIAMRFPIPLNTPDASKKHPSTFWGPTADSLDCLISDCRYPEINIGDWLVWEDMGAYTLSLAGKFNGFHPPAVLPFARKKDWNLSKDQCADQEKSMSNGIKDTIHGLNERGWVNSRS